MKRGERGKRVRHEEGGGGVDERLCWMQVLPSSLVIQMLGDVWGSEPGCSFRLETIRMVQDDVAVTTPIDPGIASSGCVKVTEAPLL